MGLLLDFLDSVFPGPEEASPPIQKNIPLFSEITQQIQIFKIPLLASFFFIVTDNTKTQLFYNFCYLATLLLSGGYGSRKI
jgi:hypothetical protein